jgi:hypothetical protein
MRRSILLPILLLGALAAPATVHAKEDFHLSTMMDDDQLLYRGDAERDATLKRMRALGVDYARVTVLWDVVAEGAKKGKRQRKRFRPDRPRTYPKHNWDRFDRLVRAALAEKVGVYLNITGPGPKWAHRKAPRREAASTRRTWWPKERQFFKFVKAVGRRYDGTYRDENDHRTILPRVQFWSIYNEPNQAGWLTPQWRKGIPWAPVMYRDLWYQGKRALDATGHDQDWVLIGETAPLGDSGRDERAHLYPKNFIRELFCVRPDGRRYTGAAARKRRCSRLRRLDGAFDSQAWAHHPYTKGVAPNAKSGKPDAITMANLDDLHGVLDQSAAASGIAAPQQSIMTEFGYETDPPDPFNGISQDRQAEWINLGEYMAWKNPRVIGQAQFLMRDVGPRKGERRNTKRYWFNYQSGIFNIDGSPKPAAGAYAMPLVLTGRPAGAVSFWGGVRFLPLGTDSEVLLQFRPAGASEFQTAGAPVELGFTGFYETSIPQTSPGTWRAVWVNPTNGAAHVSREVEVR